MICGKLERNNSNALENIVGTRRYKNCEQEVSLQIQKNIRDNINQKRT